MRMKAARKRAAVMVTNAIRESGLGFIRSSMEDGRLLAPQARLETPAASRSLGGPTPQYSLGRLGTRERDEVPQLKRNVLDLGTGEGQESLDFNMREETGARHPWADSTPLPKAWRAFGRPPQEFGFGAP